MPHVQQGLVARLTSPLSMGVTVTTSTEVRPGALGDGCHDTPLGQVESLFFHDARSPAGNAIGDTVI